MGTQTHEHVYHCADTKDKIMISSLVEVKITKPLIFIVFKTLGTSAMAVLLAHQWSFHEAPYHVDTHECLSYLEFMSYWLTFFN